MTKLAATLTTASAQLRYAISGRINRASRRDTGAQLIEYVVIVAGVCVMAVALLVIIRAAIANHTPDIK